MSKSKLKCWHTVLSEESFLEFQLLSVKAETCLIVKSYREQAPFPSYKIKFLSNPVLRVWEEQYGVLWSDKLESHESYSAAVMKYGSTIEVYDSEVVSNALKDGWFKSHHKDSVRHFAIVTTSRIVEVLSSKEPVITRLDDLGSFEQRDQKTRVLY